MLQRRLVAHPPVEQTLIAARLGDAPLGIFAPVVLGSCVRSASVASK